MIQIVGNVQTDIFIATHLNFTSISTQKCYYNKKNSRFRGLLTKTLMELIAVAVKNSSKQFAKEDKRRAF